MAEVQWIKIVTNVFDNRKIKLVETMPEGDTIIVIWFKLLCMAGSTNDGGSVYFTKDIPFTDEMLSHVFGRPLQVIRLALKTFQQFNMIEVVDNFIQISSWEKYQNVEGMDKIREQTRLRVQKHREMKALEDSNVTVTLRNATEKIREDKNRVDKNMDNTPEPPLDYHVVVDNFHSLCPRLPKIKKLDDNRRKTIRAWGNLEEIIQTFAKAGKSDFLSGGNNRNWKATFDWIIKPSNRLKILEGAYDNRGKSNNHNVTAFNDYEQRNTDYDDLEKKLLGWDKEEEP